MAEKMSFKVKSPENMMKLLCTIRYERIGTPRMISAWHHRFDPDEADDLFYDFAAKLYPQGGMIAEDQIEEITKVARHFLDTDDRTKEYLVEYDWHNMESCVVFLIDKKITYAPFGNHAKIIQNICLDYFKDFEEEVSESTIRKFILDNFRIKSSNSSLDIIANDADYLASLINCRRYHREEINDG